MDDIIIMDEARVKRLKTLLRESDQMEITNEKHIVNTFTTHLKYLSNTEFLDVHAKKGHNKCEIELNLNNTDIAELYDLRIHNIRPKNYVIIDLWKKYVFGYPKSIKSIDGFKDSEYSSDIKTQYDEAKKKELAWSTRSNVKIYCGVIQFRW